MEISNLFGGIKGKGQELGTVLGFATGSNAGFGDVMSSVQNLMNLHAPDLQMMFGSYLAEPFFRNGVIMAIAGYALKEFNIPLLGGWGSFLEKFGMGYALGSLANKVLWSATH